MFENLGNFFTIITAFLSLFGISFVIEKTPIKISPLTALRNFLVGNIEKKIDDSEKARIKSRGNEIKFELFNYEKLLMNGVKLNENDIALIKEIYQEYHDDLKQNHLGTVIYEHILELYSKQDDDNK